MITVMITWSQFLCTYVNRTGPDSDSVYTLNSLDFRAPGPLPGSLVILNLNVYRLALTNHVRFTTTGSVEMQDRPYVTVSESVWNSTYSYVHIWVYKQFSWCIYIVTDAIDLIYHYPYPGLPNWFQTQWCRFHPLSDNGQYIGSRAIIGLVHQRYTFGLLWIY